MAQEARKIVIIGGGIAGLCMSVYARQCGYQAEVLEQHHSAGGLATSWRRGDYTFETCLHWLVGSNPNGALHAQWQEVCDIGALRIIDHAEFVRIEDEHGGVLHIYTNVDRLEVELLSVAPEDEVEIHHLTAAIRRLVDMPMPLQDEAWPTTILTWLKMLPDLPLLWRLSHITSVTYGQRFQHPLLRQFFDGGATGRLSVLALVMSLAWMSGRNAGYAIGGSQALIRLIVERLAALGGHIRFDAKVVRICIENDVATGVELESGEIISADWVISAADGHATLYDMLGGRYSDAAFDNAFANYETFPSYLQVSLGTARNLSQEPSYLVLALDAPIEVDPQTRLEELPVRIFNFDPTFAPPGKTAVTCFLQTRNFTWWADLQRDDPPRYLTEKQRIADAVVTILERRRPGFSSAVEVIDVSTPATIMHLTGNWQGSMEGWLMTPGTGFGSLPQTLFGLEHFAMVGQWVQPGGGLPSGLMTARAAMHAICRQDHVAFRLEGSAGGAVAGNE
jgi:phytoene dehydrogenase-like protein